jgi:hypothetical protein
MNARRPRRSTLDGQMPVSAFGCLVYSIGYGTLDGHLPICSEFGPSRDVVRMANLLLEGPAVLRGRRVGNPPGPGGAPAACPTASDWR